MLDPDVTRSCVSLTSEEHSLVAVEIIPAVEMIPAVDFGRIIVTKECKKLS